MSDSGKSSDSQGRSRREARPDWLDGALLTPKGALIADVTNAALFLERCPDLPSVWFFRYDEMLASIICGDGAPITDGDVVDVRAWLEKQGMPRIGKDTVHDAIDHVARKYRFNPLQDELAALKWDGCERIKTWLTRYLGAPDDDYHQMIGAMFLRSMIARAMWPGCKADYMLVLEGKQRTLKSTVCRVLAGEQYFSDNLPDLAGDPIRLQQHLCGKWLIEIPELSAISRADASRLKAFLSSAIEQYTPKYGRKEVRQPRTCVFIGTTNKANYLLDETGGTRFWPVRCGDINIAALQRERNQLLAEAFQETYVEKRAWWPPPDLEEKLIAPHQDARYQGDAWEQPIADWQFDVPKCNVNGHPLTGFDAERNILHPPYFLKDIAFGAIGIQPGQLRKAEEMRLAKTLEFMGWRRTPKTNRGTPWLPPKA